MDENGLEAALNDAFNGMLEANVLDDHEAYDEALERWRSLRSEYARRYPDREPFRPLVDTQRLKTLY